MRIGRRRASPRWTVLRGSVMRLCNFKSPLICALKRHKCRAPSSRALGRLHCRRGVRGIRPEPVVGNGVGSIIHKVRAEGA